MTKPWEQDLSVHPLDSRVVINEEGLVVADVREPLSTGGREFSELFAAAPDMARALLAELDPDGHTEKCGWVGLGREGCTPRCARIRSALQKARVPL